MVLPEGGGIGDMAIISRVEEVGKLLRRNKQNFGHLSVKNGKKVFRKCFQLGTIP